MGLLLWTDEAADQAIDLGDPFLVYEALAEVARLSDASEYSDLQALPDWAEQEVNPEWLESAQVQARQFLDASGGDVTDQTRWILEKFAGSENNE